MREARAVVERVLASGRRSTGSTRASARSRATASRSRRSAASRSRPSPTRPATYGRPLATDVVRAMMLTRANGMAKAGVGVRRELVELLVAAAQRGRAPDRAHGRLGRAGRPLGDGRHRQGADRPRLRRVPRRVAARAPRRCARAGLEPIELEAKEALALISLERRHDGPRLARAGRRRRPRREHADRGRAELRGVRREPLGDPRGGGADAARTPARWRPRRACAS